MAKFSGRNARVTINGTSFKCKKWSVVDKNPGLDVTDFESGGFGEYIASVRDADITIELDLDITASVDSFDVAYPGATPAINIYVNSAAAPAAVSGAKWTFPSVYIEENSNMTGVREAVTGTIKGKASGTFTPLA